MLLGLSLLGQDDWVQEDVLFKEVDGKTYILENRYGNVYDWKDKPKYVWKYFMKFDDPGQWFKVN